MGNFRYRVIESQRFENSALSAGANEVAISEPTSARTGRGYVLWNSLSFQNNDAIEHELRLDGVSSGAKVFTLPPGGIVIIEPEDGIRFETGRLYNNDGSTSSVAGKVITVATYKEEL